MDAIESIVEELKAVCGEERLANYAADATGNDSLDSYRSLVEARMGKVAGGEWAEACEAIRREFRP